MCWMLYGAVNREANPLDLARIGKSDFYFRPGTLHDVTMSVQRADGSGRLRESTCDCGFPLGCGDAKEPELLALAEAIQSLRSVRGVKCVWFCMTWAGDQNDSEETIHIDDVDLPTFLAAAKTNCLYRIDLYRRHGAGGSN